MNADPFRDYILGFIFFKYLSERMNFYANDILSKDGFKFADNKEHTDEVYGACCAVNGFRLNATFALSETISKHRLFNLHRRWCRLLSVDVN